MSRICVMRFASDIPCAVSCDDLLIGRTEGEGLTAALPCAEHFFSFSPLPAEGYALPLYMNIDVCSPAACPEGIALRLLPEHELLCSISFPVLKRRMPCILSRRDDGADSVVLFFDAGVNVCFMHENIAVSAVRISDDCESFSTHSSGGCLVACADDTVAYAPKDDLKDVRVLKDSSFSEGAIWQNTAHPCALRLRYELRGGCSLIFSKEDTFPAFALALTSKLGLAEQCMSLLAPSLSRLLSFEDIREFFGDFHHIEYDYSSRTRLALSYELRPRIYELRLFSVELSGGRVANIAAIDHA